MLDDQIPLPLDQEDPDDPIQVREIHALTPPHPPSSSSTSEAENFMTLSREFSALVVAGSTLASDNSAAAASDGTTNLSRIGEDELEETNPLAIVPATNPIQSPRRPTASSSAAGEEVSVHRVKKEEVESKISAWQTAEIARINNRLKREDVVINGWESEQVEKATTWLKKVERNLDEQRARAIEKMQNEVARAHRKAEEKRASAEAKRGTKMARILELASLLRAVGRPPSRRSFF